MDGDIYIRPGAALDDATDIKNIVTNVREAMEKLEASIKRYIPEDIQTQWSERLRNDWESYYNNQIPASMVDMEASALNLEKAVEKAIAYSEQP